MNILLSHTPYQKVGTLSEKCIPRRAGPFAVVSSTVRLKWIFSQSPEYDSKWVNELTPHKFTNGDHLLLQQLLWIQTPATELAKHFLLSSRWQWIFYALLITDLSILKISRLHYQSNLPQCSILRYTEAKVQANIKKRVWRKSCSY